MVEQVRRWQDRCSQEWFGPSGRKLERSYCEGGYYERYRILFYGSTYLTELVIDKVKNSEVVGYVPKASQRFPVAILKAGV